MKPKNLSHWGSFINLKNELMILFNNKPPSYTNFYKLGVTFKYHIGDVFDIKDSSDLKNKYLDMSNSVKELFKKLEINDFYININNMCGLLINIPYTWFINKEKNRPIFTFTGISLNKNVTSPTFVDKSRCFGFFHNLQVAIRNVELNVADINESNEYEYVVIEEVIPGAYNPISDRHEIWFKYDKRSQKYYKCQKPNCLERVCSFGIG